MTKEEREGWDCGGVIPKSQIAINAMLTKLWGDSN